MARTTMKPKRKRIYTLKAVKWEANPLHELARLKAKELGVSTNEAVRLITLEQELSKI